MIYSKKNFLRNWIIDIKIKKKFSYLFKNAELNNNKKNIILLEFNNWTINHILSAYYCDILSKRYNARVEAYPGYQLHSSSLNQNFINKFLWSLGNKLSLKSFGIYKSFGVSNIFWPKGDFEIDQKAQKEFNKYNKMIKSKEDVQNYKINNILIGDLIYDSFLKKNLLPTINIKSFQFKKFFFDSIKYFFIMENYLNKNKVTAILGFHAVYLGAVSLRIGINRNIPCYILNIERLYSLNKKRYLSGLEYFDSKKIFKKFSKNKKKSSLEIAEKNLISRFSGLLSSDLIYSSKSAYGKKSNKRVLRNSKNLKILIAPPSFSDSPHFMGNNFFPDIYEWLECLGKTSNKSNYDWYIKCHADFTMLNDKTLYYGKKFTKKYPKIKLIDSKASHNQLISEGINYVLTVNGTISGEYPYFNVNAINASENHSYALYDFSITPKNRLEYIKLINNLKKPMAVNKKKQILENYYMKYEYFNNRWFFEELNNVKNSIKGYTNFVRHEIYEYWLDNFEMKIHKKRYKRLKKFFNSKNYTVT